MSVTILSMDYPGLGGFLGGGCVELRDADDHPFPVIVVRRPSPAFHALMDALNTGNALRVGVDDELFDLKVTKRFAPDLVGPNLDLFDIVPMAA